MCTITLIFFFLQTEPPPLASSEDLGLATEESKTSIYTCLTVHVHQLTW